MSLENDLSSSCNIPKSAEEHIAALEFHLPEASANAREMRVQAVNHPDTHPAVLEHIASNGPHYLVKRVADHPATNFDTLFKLACHEHYEVRAALANNKDLPTELQWQLAADEHPDVRFAMAEAYDIDQLVLAVLIEDENPFVASRARTTLQRLQSGSARPLRMPLTVAENPTTARRKLASG